MMICSFEKFEGKIHGPRAGGKGRVLAQLFQSGYPVPDGFILFPEIFEDGEISEANWSAVLNHYHELAPESVKVAVRSSAQAEDSESASFAGAFETVLNVDSEDALRKAIQLVYESRESDRVQAYSREKGLPGPHSMAIVVQRMVSAEYAGVLFTLTRSIKASPEWLETWSKDWENNWSPVKKPVFLFYLTRRRVK